MAFDGSGNYSLTYTFATEAASPPIAISKLDTEFSGIATGLSLAILRNGNGKPTANIDWNAKKITNLADATADTDAVNRQTGDARWAQLGAANAFTANFTLSGTEPGFRLYETDAGDPTDYCSLVLSGNQAILFGWDASASAQRTFLSGNVTTGAVSVTGAWSFAGAVALSSTLAVTGAVTIGGSTAWHAGNDGSGSGLDADLLDGNQASAFVLASGVTSGSFTAYLRAANNGADITSGTAYYRKFNNVVTLFIPFLQAGSTQTNLVIDGLPAAVIPDYAFSQICAGRVSGSFSAIEAGFNPSWDYINLYQTDGNPFPSATGHAIQPTTFTYIAD